MFRGPCRALAYATSAGVLGWAAAACGRIGYSGRQGGTVDAAAVGDARAADVPAADARSGPDAGEPLEDAPPAAEEDLRDDARPVVCEAPVCEWRCDRPSCAYTCPA